MKISLSILLWVGLVSAGLTQTDEVRRLEKGNINGVLQNSDGTPRQIHNVAVFVCDAKTGHPVVAKSGKPIGPDRPLFDLQQMWYDLTDEHGRFEFIDLPAGEYRLVAQKWKNADHVCWMKDEDHPLELHGETQVDVDAIRTAKVAIKPFGDAKLSVRTDPDEGNAFLLIGLKPTLGEPILGFWGWGTEFPKHVVGLTHMNRGTTEIHGLPNDAKVHLSLINYDNNPGTGGTQVDTARDTVATIPIYASWSNGYYKTPEHMNALVAFISKENKPLADLLMPGGSDELKNASGNLDKPAFYAWMQKHANEMVEVGDLGKIRIVDVVAASSYLRVRKVHESRLERKKKNKAPKNVRPDDRDKN